MGNESFCAKDTRDFKEGTLCGRETQFRNSTAITIVNHIPVINGPPLNFQKQETFKKVQKSAAEFCRENHLPQSYAPLVARIIAYGHDNLFQAYRKLPQNRKQQFLEEIKFIDIDFMDSLYHNLILNKKSCQFDKIEPPMNLVELDEIREKERKQYLSAGKEIIDKKQVAVLLMCGGYSSRFLFQDKFMYPLELKSQKTILELMLERIRRNFGISEGQIAQIPIVFACNTSNRHSLENFLKIRKFCGFNGKKMRFLQIPNHPILDENGKLCLSFQYQVLSRPSGTAKCVQELLSSSIYEFLKKQGINYIHIIGMQNIAQNPVDPVFLGYTQLNNLSIVGKCTECLYPTENFHRYGTYGDGRNCLITVDDLMGSQVDHDKVELIIEDCPVAMNSIMCNLHELRKMVKEYGNSLFLSREYRATEKCENFYNFLKEKPQVKKKVFIFENDIGHLFTCSKNHHFLKVPRNEFVPVISRNNQYSMREACKRLIELHEQKMNFSRSNYDENSTV